jgi:hypothetical protein
MKQKIYQTTQPKSKNKNKMTIKVDWLSIPNKMHLDAQIRFPARVQEDKRFKKPKHKKKDVDWD